MGQPNSIFGRRGLLARTQGEGWFHAMPFWIEGWIEVARLPDTAGEHAWFGVVDLGALVDVADEDTERLFGLSKSCMSGKAVNALAANRGVPSNPSSQVQRELASIVEHELKHGAGEYGGYTHAIWDEIRGYELTVTEPLESSQWSVPFSIARVLEEEFGADRIRFIVWFNW